MVRIRNMDSYRDIIYRLRSKQSVRAIHRDTGSHRTVIRQLLKLSTKHGWLDPVNPMPSNKQIQECYVTPGIDNKKSPKRLLDPFLDEIKSWHSKGCSPTVMHQLLQGRCNCSKSAVQRFVRKYFPKQIDPVMIREAIRGEIADVDYGYFGLVYDPELKKNRRAMVFSMRLRFSRRAYRELSFDQNAKSFFMAHVHAFEYFGGVPHKVVLDNLKAGVIHASHTDPQINKSYIKLAEHYNFLISPCAPRTPQHKGGVENDIKYIKNNFWPLFCAKQREKGRDIPWAHELPEALVAWGRDIADNRRVAGLNQTPEELFLQEIDSLQQLPLERWDPIAWTETEVPLTWRIRYDNVYYSVPCDLIGKKVSICAGTSVIKIFHNHCEVATHSRLHDKGAFQRKAEHAPEHLENVLKSTRVTITALVEKKGGALQQVAMRLLLDLPQDHLNAVRCILELEKKVGLARLEAACVRALQFGEIGYTSIKRILDNGLESEGVTEIVPSDTCRDFAFSRSKEQFKI